MAPHTTAASAAAAAAWLCAACFFLGCLPVRVDRCDVMPASDATNKTRSKRASFWAWPLLKSTQSASGSSMHLARRSQTKPPQLYPNQRLGVNHNNDDPSLSLGIDYSSLQSNRGYLRRAWREERQDAKVLYQSLREAKKLIKRGVKDARVIKKALRTMINAKRSARIDYVACVDTEKLKEQKTIKKGTLIASAVWIGKTRLIDNCILRRSG